MRRYRRDAGLSLRIALSLVGLYLLYVPFAVCLLSWLWVAGGLRAVGAFAVLLTLFLVMRPLWAGRVGLLSAGRAPQTGEAAHVQATVERLCGLADLPVPRVELMDLQVPNAFTVGRLAAQSTIVVTTGLLARLDDDEVEAVIAHELAHIANHDALVMVIVSFPARVLRAIALGFTRLTRRNPVAWIALLYLVPFFVGAWCAAALTTLLLMTFSRYRKLVADRGAALLTGRPETLMSALQKLSAGAAGIPADDLRAVAGLNPFFVVPARTGDGLGLDPFVLFPTHPTLAQRLEHLSALARTQGSAIPTDAVPLAVAEPERPPNPHATLAFCLAFVTWPLGWAVPLLVDDEFGGVAAYAELFALLTGLGAFVFALQALGRAQRGAGGGGLAALSLLILAAPLVFTFVGFAVVATGV
jgi:heat shock protein HtpX